MITLENVIDSIGTDRERNVQQLEKATNELRVRLNKQYNSYGGNLEGLQTQVKRCPENGQPVHNGHQ